MESTLLTLFATLGLGILLSLAYVAERELIMRWVIMIALLVGDLALLMFGSVMGLGWLISRAAPEIWAGATADATSIGAAGGSTDAAPALDPEALVSPFLAGAFLVLAVVGLLLLLHPVRRAVARWLPIDPDRTVHTVALHLALVLVAVAALVSVVVTALADDQAALDQMTRTIEEGGLAQLWVQNLGFAILGFLGVGFFVRRSGRECLARLGLTRQFAIRWWLLATLLGLASGFAVDALWQWLEPESLEVVERLTDALFGPLLEYGLAGAITIGVSAGIGEEIVFRGAAQPRLGLALTAFLFAALHTQYTVSPALIQMLVMGLLLGLVRIRSNTTTAIGTHATYNFVLVLLAVYGPELSP